MCYIIYIAKYGILYWVKIEKSHIMAFLLLVFTIIVSVQANNVSVPTQVGEFIGFQNNVDVDGTNVTVSMFLGIPYAEPPVGNLRFQKPEAKAALTKPLVVHEHGAQCIQLTRYAGKRPTSEDCLFLNIYAPEKHPGDGGLAVMVFIHGGAFVVGAANPYVSDILAASGGVIVVTINYRLSVLGFLNIKDNEPSNFGLWDQHLAIKWVHANIRAFGGDSGRVTIFGQSAGAGSVIYQGIYPGNKGLFHRIIAESGTASAPWGESRQPLAEARKFASLVNCNQKSSSAMLRCLRGISTALINSTLNDMSNGFFRNPMPFVPSPDNEFIPISPRIVLNKDNHDDRAKAARTMFGSVDLMMGVNSGDGFGGLSPAFGVNGDLELFLPNRSYFQETLVPLCARSQYGNDVSSAVLESLVNGYTSWNDPNNPNAIREKFLDMQGDFLFLASMVQTVELYTEVSSEDPYMYYFTAVPSTKWKGAPSWFNRANHGEEMLYVFGEKYAFELNGGEFKDWEQELSTAMMTMWANFAKTGNPNTRRHTGVDWKPYTSANHRYLDIGKYLNQTVTKERLFEQRTHLWNIVLPLINKETSTGPCYQTTSGGSVYSIGYFCYGLVLTIAIVVDSFY